MDESALIEELSRMTLSSGVCYVYDEAMLEHIGPNDDHPERPSRIRTIHEYLTQSGLIEKMHVIQSRYATESEIALAHDQDFVGKVLLFQEQDSFNIVSDDGIVEQKKILFPFDSDTYFCHSSAQAAKLACGSVLAALDTVLSANSRCDRGFACIRPPGHHATYASSMGFCLFNNVAIAANYARTKYGLSRVAIFDWDVHHGNGTNDIFSNDSGVLFMSIHRFDRGKFYPGTGDWTDVGSGKGKGFTINMPIDGSYGDDEMLYLFDKVVLAALADFKPELILVSAGFDAAENDPLGLCHVQTETFGLLTRLLLENIGGKILLVLEGGYNLKSIGNACVSCCEALLNTTVTPLRSPLLSGISSPSSSSSTASSVRSVPHGVAKTSTVRMVNKLTELLAETGGVTVPVVPALNPFTSRKDRKKKATKTVKTPPPEEPGEVPEFLLVSGAGHAGAVLRYDSEHVIKSTTVREGLAYVLIAESVGEKVHVSSDDPTISVLDVLEREKERVRFEENRDSFAQLSRFVNKCTSVIFHSETTASVIMEDMTRGFAVDDNLGVLDIKLGTVYHTPDDSPEKVGSRQAKAIDSSAAELGIRVLACKCMDGFSVGKHKAKKMKLMEQMVPLVRRFLYSDIEAFDAMISDMEKFVSELRSALSDKIKFNFISSSVLFVIGRGPNKNVMLRCKMIDLAHLFPDDTDNSGDFMGKEGLLKGCTNLLKLVNAAKEPSYESA